MSFLFIDFQSSLQRLGEFIVFIYEKLSNYEQWNKFSS